MPSSEVAVDRRATVQPVAAVFTRREQAIGSECGAVAAGGRLNAGRIGGAVGNHAALFAEAGERNARAVAAGTGEAAEEVGRGVG